MNEEMQTITLNPEFETRLKVKLTEYKVRIERYREKIAAILSGALEQPKEDDENPTARLQCELCKAHILRELLRNKVVSLLSMQTADELLDIDPDLITEQFGIIKLYNDFGGAGLNKGTGLPRKQLSTIVIQVNSKHREQLLAKLAEYDKRCEITLDQYEADWSEKERQHLPDKTVEELFKSFQKDAAIKAIMLRYLLEKGALSSKEIALIPGLEGMPNRDLSTAFVVLQHYNENGVREVKQGLRQKAAQLLQPLRRLWNGK